MTIGKEQLNEINQIKDLISISYQDVLSPNGTHTSILIPGFYVIYGSPKSKTIYLTSLDPFFNEFVSKLKKVYLEEKDHVIAECFGLKQYIEIDELSKKLLLTDALINTDYGCENYLDKESYDESLLMEEDVLRSLLPIVEYHLKTTLKEKWFQKTVTDVKLSHGTNGVYYLTAAIDYIEKKLPIYYEPGQDSFTVTIGNIFDKCIPLVIKCEFKPEGITVNSKIIEYNFDDESKYVVINDKIVKIRKIICEGGLLSYQDDDLPVTKSEIPVAIYELDAKQDKKGETASTEEEEKKKEKDIIDWYELPWNSYLGIKENKIFFAPTFEETEEEQKSRIVDNKIIYVGPTPTTFFIKEISIKRFHRKLDDVTLGGNIPLDSVNKRRIGLIGDGATVVETYFCDGTFGSGSYKEKLSDNYYYQVYGELKKGSGVFIGKEQGLIEKSDLFDAKIYVKEGKK